MNKECPRCNRDVKVYTQGMMNGRSFQCPDCNYWGSHFKWNYPERYIMTGEYN
jgi:transposase-like protein